MLHYQFLILTLRLERERFKSNGMFNVVSDPSSVYKMVVWAVLWVAVMMVGVSADQVSAYIPGLT